MAQTFGQRRGGVIGGGQYAMPYGTPVPAPAATPAPVERDAPGLPTAEPVKGLRFLSGFIDAFILVMISLVVISVSIALDIRAIDQTGVVPESAGMPGLTWLTLFVLWVGYGMVFESLYSATPGKMLTGTRIVNRRGAPLSTGQAVGRNLGKILSSLVPFYIPYFMVFMTKDSQSLHDVMSSTRVYRVRDLETSPGHVFA